MKEFCFGLRFGEWKSGAEAKRWQERSRSKTTVAVPQAEARRTFRMTQMPLVTSARFEQRNGWVGGKRGLTLSPWSGANSALVTAKNIGKCLAVPSTIFRNLDQLSVLFVKALAAF